MSFPPVKVFLLVLATISLHLAIKPPLPPPTKADKVFKKTNLFERIVRPLGIFLRAVGIGCMMTECAMLLAFYFQNPWASSILSGVCPRSTLPSLSSLSSLSPIFILGIGIMYISGVIRVWSYKTLGTLFTYEITIRRDHKLVSSGPYAIVRHPGYTASTLMMGGVALTVCSPGSYVNECHLMSTTVRWILIPWFGLLAFTAVSLLGRGSVEDANLKKEFGERWEDYRRLVAYKYLPGVI